MRKWPFFTNWQIATLLLYCGNEINLNTEDNENNLFFILKYNIKIIIETNISIRRRRKNVKAYMKYDYQFYLTAFIKHYHVDPRPKNVYLTGFGSATLSTMPEQHLTLVWWEGWGGWFYPQFKKKITYKTWHFQECLRVWC